MNIQKYNDTRIQYHCDTSEMKWGRNIKALELLIYQWNEEEISKR